MTPDDRSASGEFETRKRVVPSRFDARIGRWLEATAGLVALTALVAGAIAVAWHPARTAAFGGSLTLAVVVVAIVTGVAIDRTARGGDPGPLTVASWITVTRGALLACFVGAFWSTTVVPESGVETLTEYGERTAETDAWLPAVLFAAVGLLDAVDGMVARTTGAVTDLGARLDAELDGLTALAGSVAVVALGAASVAFLAVGAARYLYVGSLWWRRRRERPVRDLPSSRVRAPLSAAVLVSIWLAVSPITTAQQSVLLTALVAVPFLANFLWDWLAVTARVSR
ncbi:CDP-alcohol phosphatidyltransferase family protein [Natrarchaeobius oligotrophus]|uniref:CDP-alcohol phosphatidyltransferase family protein n=1 Tax=Natrarchaeobius chitinivorans TaxID=1679083 RepID=A0A3N6PKI7_NATCH|nr:CDP-alcohol phosphatidyltransferase family protein [Natrarchaeobius chitinivorans]RQH01800.1 CDP-alcohol phosphatidyltransferase family protein [Natrarchaeobius chitinivorans]